MPTSRREFLGRAGAGVALAAGGQLAGASARDLPTAPAPTPARRWPVVYNLDPSEFFVGTFGKPVPETLDRFVQTHADLGVTSLFVCVNYQRTNYRSDVWESDWDGYDPAKGFDQPFFAKLPAHQKGEAQWVKDSYELHKAGCDYPAHMIAQARKRGVKPWLSLRMNDSHFPGEPGHHYHSTFWRDHPQWRLPNGGLDYERAEVRTHYLKLVREVCGRYDLDGLELDFLRFPLYFRPGREQHGLRLMDAFVEEVRDASRKAAARLGHSVELGVRVATSPWVARAHGTDAVAWAKAGLVDLVVAAPFWTSTDTDVPAEVWKGLLAGTGARVAVSLEDGIDSGATGRRTATIEEVRGTLCSAWSRGADAAYFFNLFTMPYHYWPREHYNQVLRDAGDPAALRDKPRRHAVSVTDPWARGEPRPARRLPASGRGTTVRLHTGPKPGDSQQAWVELITPGSDEKLTVRVNGVACPWARRSDGDHIKESGWKRGEVGKRHVYDVPADALNDGYNLVEVGAAQDVRVAWLEIAVR